MSGRPAASVAQATPLWQWTLRDRLALYGHRNWVVIADSAYPAQARPGIEIIACESDQLDVLGIVLAALSSAKHVRPIVYSDAELRFVEEEDAPGITAYRRRLAALLDGLQVKELPHEQIIATLDRAADSFRVLIIKSGMAIPYTSVFLELDCGYWNADSESRLRNAMSGLKK
jgi:RbsD/FucU transport protein family protein